MLKKLEHHCLLCFFTISYLLHGVIRKLGTGPIHRSMVLDCQVLKFGTKGLLLLRHHTVCSSLDGRKHACLHLRLEGGEVEVVHNHSIAKASHNSRTLETHY